MSENYPTVSGIAERLKVSNATAFKIYHRIGCLRLGSGPKAPICMLAEDYEAWSAGSRQDPAEDGFVECARLRSY